MIAFWTTFGLEILPILWFHYGILVLDRKTSNAFKLSCSPDILKWAKFTKTVVLFGVFVKLLWNLYVDRHHRSPCNQPFASKLPIEWANQNVCSFKLSSRPCTLDLNDITDSLLKRCNNGNTCVKDRVCWKVYVRLWVAKVSTGHIRGKAAVGSKH